MINKPRIAFCFSGQARTLDQTYIFFQKNLFDAAKEQGFDYDVFCAVEDDEDVDKVNLLNPTKVEKIKSSEVEEIIEEKYGDFIKNELRNNYFVLAYSKKFCVNVLQQMYKVEKSVKMCLNDGNYDIVMRLRFDIIFFYKFNWIELKKSIDKNYVVCNTIYGGSKKYEEIRHNHVHYIQDFFFIGNVNTFFTLGKCFSDFKNSFYGCEIKRYFKLYFKLHKYINILNCKRKYRLKIFNYILGLLSFPMYQMFLTETIYYYRLKKKYKIEKTEIPLMLFRKDIKKSLLFLKNNTNYCIW